MKRKRSHSSHAPSHFPAPLLAAIDGTIEALKALRVQLSAFAPASGPAIERGLTQPESMHISRPRTICRCTHGIEHHPNGGPCTYGHGTAFGGCTCPGWHPYGMRGKRKDASAQADERAAREQAPRPAPKPVPEHHEPTNHVSGVATPPKGAPPLTALVPPTKAEKRLLHALAQSREPMHRRKLALWTGYSPDSGGYGQALADLRTDGFIEGSSERISITAAGRRAAGDIEPLPTGRALLNWWIDKRPKGDGDVLYVLAALAQGGPMSRDEIAEKAHKSPTSGGFGQSLANLRRLGLIDGPSSAITIAPELMSDP